LRTKTVFIAVVAAFALAHNYMAIAQNALSDILASKVIRIAIPTDFPPYGFVTSKHAKRFRTLTDTGPQADS
jgi:polar amino acid transport system substrate-binding protein